MSWGGYTIFDLDNCLSDDGWRIPRIDWSAGDNFRRYHNYHSLAPFDSPAHREAFADARRRSAIILLTSRPIHYRAATVEWLNRHHLNFEILLMRNDHDHRHSVEVKRWQLAQLVHYDLHLDDVLAAYDDRPEIVAMYREHGILAYEMAIHNTCAYTAPLGVK